MADVLTIFLEIDDSSFSLGDTVFGSIRPQEIVDHFTIRC